MFTTVNAYIKNTVAEVRQHSKMKEMAATNGTEGTLKMISSKTQESILVLLERDAGRRRLTRLTTQVENLHGVSHFKNETFNSLQYAQDFGTISKESFKRTTKWGAKYFTHEKSYYPVPKSSVELRDVDLVKPCPAGKVDPNIEAAMKGTCQAKDDKRRNNKGQSGSPAASCIFQCAIVY